MPQVNIQCKLDGISLRATYQNGKLVELVTRGDGIQGDDITANAPHLNNLPMQLDVVISIPGTVHVRAEGVMYEEDFNTHFKPKGFANARNTVSGLLKGRSAPADLKHIHFVAYKIYADDVALPNSEQERVQVLKGMGFEVPGINVVVFNADEAIRVYQDYDKEGGDRTKLPYCTDGLVMNVDSISDQSRFADVGGRPGYAVAVKPSPKAAVTIVKGISWEMGLSGSYTPVALVEPCELDGTTCKRVNLFNLDFLTTWVNGGELKVQKSLNYPLGKKKVKGGFGIGATVVIIRTGDVLPYLEDVVVSAPQSSI